MKYTTCKDTKKTIADMKAKIESLVTELSSVKAECLYVRRYKSGPSAGETF